MNSTRAKKSKKEDCAGTENESGIYYTEFGPRFTEYGGPDIPFLDIFPMAPTKHPVAEFQHENVRGDYIDVPRPRPFKTDSSSNAAEVEDGHESATEVMKRQVNVRDAPKKSIKKQKEAARLGAGKPTTKTHDYNALLPFLRKVFLERKTEDTRSADIGQPEAANERTPQNTHENEVTQAIAKDFKTPVTRKRKLDNVELEMIQALKDQADRHLSFFRGIIPSLNTFDDDEILEFQMLVLQKITSMKQRKKMVSYNQYSAEIHPMRINTSRQATTSTEGHLYQNVRPSTSTGSSDGYDPAEKFGPHLSPASET
ncbi:hypothetical protein L798_03477 [Zootermopsis nevadensis]|uniref:BESS domain-containing protein n=1 Tax=Zootermopsis nevadensis TaxID=136037 RepID=A0A067QG76_ZOONE|nr:hypothetical protein L798_03477 [Zootermopsis nevadensis]